MRGKNQFGGVIALGVLAILACPLTSMAQHKVMITPTGHGPRLESLGAEFFVYTGGVPVVPQDFWWDDLGTGDLSMCHLGSTGDRLFGFQVWFTGAAKGGGWTQSGIAVYYWGDLYQVFPDYWINSPDINGDMLVNLIDVATFARDYAQGYHFRSDFIYDGRVNLADVGEFATHLGEACP